MIAVSVPETSKLGNKLQNYFTPRRRSFMLHRLAEVGLLALAGLVPMVLLVLCIMLAAPIWLGVPVALIFGGVSYLFVAQLAHTQHVPGTPDDPNYLYLRPWQRNLIICLAPVVVAVAMALSVLLIALCAAAFLLTCIFPRETVLSD